MNSELADIFLKLAGQQLNQYKGVAFTNASFVIRNLDFKITDVNQLKGFKGIGSSSLEVVSDYLANGKSKRIEEGEIEDNPEELLPFIKIRGFGPAKAKELIDKGYHSIKQLINDGQAGILSVKLNSEQRTGLFYALDLEIPIPRKDIEIFEKAFKLAAPDLEWIIAGSYRRGLQESNNINLLVRGGSITMDQILNIVEKINYRMNEHLFSIVIEELGRVHSKDFTLSTNNSIETVKSVVMIRIFPSSPARKLDIILVPEKEWASALLHYTGSKNFNIYMSKTALERGYSLSEHSVTDVNTNEKYYFDTERKIFNFLKIKYLRPYQRL